MANLGWKLRSDNGLARSCSKMKTKACIVYTKWVAQARSLHTFVYLGNHSPRIRVSDLQLLRETVVLVTFLIIYGAHDGRTHIYARLIPA